MQTSITNGGTMELIGTRRVFAHFGVMSNELSTPKILFCPQETDPSRQSASTFASTIPVGSVNQVPFTCPSLTGVRPPWYPLGQEAIVIFDEAEHPRSVC